MVEHVLLRCIDAIDAATIQTAELIDVMDDARV
jgi:hypothetical protein